MKLSDLLPALPEHHLNGDPQTAIARLCYDSRGVREHDVFFAWKGAVTDGHKFIPQAREKGAAAIVLEDGSFIAQDHLAYVQVKDARRSLAWAAAEYYRHPARALRMVGITGTNGKTTTSFLLKHLLSMKQGRVGLVGTVRYEIGEEILSASRTTPEGLDLQELLARMRAAGCTSVVMEVSSHALDQGRVEPIDYEVGVFTNLTQDHLDYHGTMENYFRAKQRLFENLARRERGGTAVVNVDDVHGRRLLTEMPEGVRVLRYSARGAEAELVARDIECSANGSRFILATPEGEARVFLPLPGLFNVENALAALGAGRALGQRLETMIQALATAPAVPGRLETLRSADGVTVVVDYAHTDDALAKALRALRELKPRELWCVVGCGGDRDRTKRSKMALAACAGADCVLFTSDNPRSEKPADIIKDMTDGVKGQMNFQVIEDRREAIALAIASAQPGDIICLAGKGHEDYQEIAGRRWPFSDREVAREFLERRVA